MRVLVCGGRNFNDGPLLTRALLKLHRDHQFTVVMHGDANGADRMAGAWARWVKLKELKFPADWAALGKAAGPVRNQRMLDEGKPEMIIAFPGGPGTKDMVTRARAFGVPVVEVKP